MILLCQLERGMDRLFLPLGPLYLADALEQHRHKVELFHEHGNSAAIDLLVAKVKRDEPKWVGFSTIIGPSLTPTIEASKRIKAETDSKIIWGGMFPTFVPRVILEPYVDGTVRGEGEEWVTGRPVHMDEFQPAWHLIEGALEKYGDTIHLTTLRGCKWRCGFCYSPAFWKCQWKGHSVDKVIEIFFSYPGEPDKVEFRDDYFFVDVRRANEIIKALDTPWSSTIRAGDLTPKFVEALPLLPDELSMGVETASQRLLDLMTKDITLEEVELAVNTAEQYSINLFLTFIKNLPTETEEEQLATLEMAERLEKDYKNIRCMVKKYRAYPGTALFDLSIQMGFSPPRTTEEWAEYALEVWK